jgi:hypothetical protein
MPLPALGSRVVVYSFRVLGEFQYGFRSLSPGIVYAVVALLKEVGVVASLLFNLVVLALVNFGFKDAVG